MNYHTRYEENRLKEVPEIAPFFQDINRDTAARAFNGTSQFPERAGSFARSDYAQMLISDREAVERSVQRAINRGATVLESAAAIDAWFVEHRAGLKSKTLSYLSSHGNCISSFITGPSNFPVRRSQKANNSADNRYNEIGIFRKASKRRILKELLPYGDGQAIRGTDPDATTKLKAKLADLENRQALMKSANKIARSKKLSDADKVAQLMGLNIGNAAAKDLLSPRYSYEKLGFQGYLLTNNNANIKRVKDRILVLEREAEAPPAEAQEFENFKMFEDEGRVQFEFDGKPDANIRTILKRNGFKWSPTRVTWVRQATANGRAAGQNVINQLKAEGLQ